MTLQTPPPPPPPPPSLPLPLSFPLPPLPTLPFFPPPSPPSPPPPFIKFENKISPSILLIIVILTVIFFISGLLHLLIRFILKPINREADHQDQLDSTNVTVLQGQLQQLFHLHDAGVDQSCIDTLPIFLYKAIIGLKDPFDCAVCLCEFEPDDKLRLLPICSHAFHLACIDTWLLSHSTCPLCRTSLLLPHDHHCLLSPPANCCSPMLLVLESSREISCTSEVADQQDDDGDHQSMQIVQVLDDDIVHNVLEEKKLMVPVKLGKFKSSIADHDELATQGTSSDHDQKIDQRRCFSMGSCEYVMDDRSLLQVAIKPSSNKKKIMSTTSDRFHSSRSFESSHHASSINGSVLQKKESFSFSKIWLKEKHKESSSVLSRSEEAPSFARRTLLWLVGKQENNKMVNQLL